MILLETLKLKLIRFRYYFQHLPNLRLTQVFPVKQLLSHLRQRMLTDIWFISVMLRMKQELRLPITLVQRTLTLRRVFIR